MPIAETSGRDSIRQIRFAGLLDCVSMVPLMFVALRQNTESLKFPDPFIE
jgi:hypothetical protein